MRIAFYVFVALIIGGLISLQAFVSGLPFAEATDNKLTPFQEKQLDLFKDLNSLFITLAVAVIGGVGAFVLDREKVGRLPAGQKARAIASMSFAGVSVFSGYLSHETVVWMLRKGFFNIEFSRLVWSDRVQFWSFAIAVFFLADFFYGALRSSQSVAAGKSSVTPVVLIVGALFICTAPTAHSQARHERRDVDVQLHIDAEVATAVTKWEEAAGVTVTGDARGIIVKGFADQQSLLHSLAQKQRLTPQQEATFADAIVEHYLYDLRDRKLLQTSKKPSATPGRRFYLPQAADTYKLAIEPQDVMEFSPSNFLLAMRPVLESPVGYMDILSIPDQATITIDGEKKPQLTCRNFVSSPGEHTVIIKKGSAVDCTEKVTVSPQKTKTVSCPKGKKVRCRLPNK